MGLVSKLAEVMGTCGWIKKSGYNEFHKYSYAQEADIVNMLRDELAKRQIMIFPDVKAVTRIEHTTETMKWNDATRQKEPVLRKTYLTEVTIDWTFSDGESGEEKTIRSHGVGEDNMDKGFYKAFTGCEKYLLMKTFLLPTGDDPEKDSQEERDTAKQSGRAAAQAKGEELTANMRARVEAHKKGNVTIQDLEKAIGNVSQEVKTPELTVVQVGVDKYEIAGEESTIDDFRELLAAWGKRVRDPKTKLPVVPTRVLLDATGLDNFKREFCENRHGVLTPLKATWAKP